MATTKATEIRLKLPRKLSYEVRIAALQSYASYWKLRYKLLVLYGWLANYGRKGA